MRVKADVVASDETRVGPARDPELRSHRRARAGGGVGLRPAARRGGGAGDGGGAGSRRRAGRRARRRWRRARAALLARLGLPVDYERRFDAQAQAGIAVDKKRRGSTIRFVFVPTPGRNPPRGDRARRHRLTPALARRAAKA